MRYIRIFAAFNQEVEGLQIYLATDTGGCNGINGTAADGTLEGTPADDCIDGKAGADSMSGLGGDDSYVVDNRGDTVIEGAGGGTDMIASSVTYSLPIYVEIAQADGHVGAGGRRERSEQRADWQRPCEQAKRQSRRRPYGGWHRQRHVHGG